MSDYDQKIKEFEEELSKTQYNKATQHHIGLVKAKIAKLKERAEARRTSGKKGEGYSVKKTGHATVLLLGYPSVGKSTLLNAITNAKSEVGAYDFTTLTVVPGLLVHRGAKIQVLDVPGVVEGAASGRGRGREVLSVMRSADLAIIIVDVNHPEHYNVLAKEVYDANLRLNEKEPDVKIKPKARGGISIASTVKLKHLTKDTIKGIMHEMGISNADVVIRSNITADQLIDVIEKNKVYIPAITILNKVDMISEEKLQQLKKRFKDSIAVSAKERRNTEQLKDLIFERLGIMRIYCKSIGKKADLEEPVIMKRGSTVEDLCTKLHKDFASRFRYAKVWGRSAKYPGQEFRRMDHVLEEGDIVELHLD